MNAIRTPDSSFGTIRSVLIVEDDPAQARLVARWLRSSGFEVTHADRVNTALGMAQDRQWDLILCDIDLPDGSGLDLARRLKSIAPDSRVLLATAYASVDLAINALRARVDDFMVKPLNRVALERKMKELGALEPAATVTATARTVLAIGAHPDDVEIGVGATLARHSADGDRVIVLTLTGGEQGGEERERSAEALGAARILGATLEMTALPDTEISEGGATIRTIEEAMARYSPDVVYTHTPHDLHQDHRNTYRATMVAARGVPNVFCYQSPSTTIEFKPTQFVDVSETLDRKLEALAYHGSQGGRAYLADDLVRATARYWGRFAGYREVEPLEVVRTSA